jgi:D-alanyl-D-alanine carboxypeptidase
VIDKDITRRGSMALAIGAISATGLTRARAAERLASVGPLWADLDAAGAKLIADRQTPGVSISVLRKGAFIYSKGFGTANIETQTPTTPNSVYEIGSITKQFTAASLMQLADLGKLSVDDPFSKYFPDFPRGSEITLRDMLTHTAGLGDFYGNPLKPGLFSREARLDYDADALYKMLLTANPLFAYTPRTVFVYSNMAYVLLGLVVEKVSGRPYDIFFKDGVIARAGLTNTAVDNAADVVPHRASGYVVREGEAGRWNNAPYIARSFAGGAGSMRSTSEDLCRWHEALLGGQVLSAASLKQMITPHRLKDGELPKIAAGPGEKGQPAQYGFGLESKTIAGRETVGHHGHIAGFTSSLLTFRIERISIAIIANCDFAAASEQVIREAAVAAVLHVA